MRDPSLITQDDALCIWIVIDPEDIVKSIKYMPGPSNPEQSANPQIERSGQQHQAALEKIVHPHFIVENQKIFDQLRNGEITIDEARSRSELLLIKVGSRDHMTNLDNARAAEVKVEELMGYCEENNLPLLGLYCDGDFFKQINDKLGHDVGDFVIKALAHVIERTTRKTDLQTYPRDEGQPEDTTPSLIHKKAGTTNARMGGDEFFIALPGATVEDARVIFTRISERFARITDRVMGRSMTITAGVVLFDKTIDSNPQGFIKRCERAMQFGKDEHKGGLTIGKDNDATSEPVSTSKTE